MLNKLFFTLIASSVIVLFLCNYSFAQSDVGVDLPTSGIAKCTFNGNVPFHRIKIVNSSLTANSQTGIAEILIKSELDAGKNTLNADIVAVIESISGSVSLLSGEEVTLNSKQFEFLISKTRKNNGKTGFPIIDAGMRELNATGYMHNRVRIIVASFLTKDLHLDWRLGEKYFAQNLVDYDPCVNNGNWQWAASTGCDAQPYFRIFNPWRQQERFDPKCSYIKLWIPELTALDPKQIHSLWKSPVNVKGYASPMLSHEIESKISKELYAKAARS